MQQKFVAIMKTRSVSSTGSATTAFKRLIYFPCNFTRNQDWNSRGKPKIVKSLKWKGHLWKNDVIIYVTVEFSFQILNRDSSKCNAVKHFLISFLFLQIVFQICVEFRFKNRGIRISGPCIGSWSEKLPKYCITTQKLSNI